MRPEKALMPASPAVKKTSILSHTGWGGPAQWDALPTFKTLRMSSIVTTRMMPRSTARGDDEAGEAVVGLPSKGRVMSPSLSGPSYSYWFCQYVNPELGHDGGPSTCFEG